MAFKAKFRSLEDDHPVTVPPPSETIARVPPVTDTPPKLDEPPKQSDPVGQAAKSAIVDRLRETERAQEFQREAPQPQPPPQADDPDEQQRVDQFIAQLEEAIRPLPEEAKPWFRQRPEYIFDPEKSAAANHFHNVTRREIGEEFTPRYFERMETHLGIRQPEPSPQPRASAPSRPVGPPVSAPPSRESPSMSTGHPVSDSRVTLTAEEASLAKLWGITPQEYAKQKQIYQRQKQAGMHGG